MSLNDNYSICVIVTILLPIQNTNIFNRLTVNYLQQNKKTMILNCNITPTNIYYIATTYLFSWLSECCKIFVNILLR